ncbi:unnamed protein product [Taenia asiatica]|uniref:Uncharacterized protein n=1 Tax=Taenia asiatica TaxID=60517 RepID=A0A3P6Q2B4_TAEAS|nr:unnamed protein product [Taenia asiatica]
MPDYKNFIVEQGEDFVGPHITIYQPPRCGLLAITPTTDVAFIRNLTIANPENLPKPLQPLLLPKVPSDPINIDDLVALILYLLKDFSDPMAEMPDMVSWLLPASLIPCNFPAKFDAHGSAEPHWKPVSAISRHIGWSVQSKGSKQLSSIKGAVTLPTVSTGQGELLPQPTLCQPHGAALTPAVQRCFVQPTALPRGTPAAALTGQASSTPHHPPQPALLLEQVIQLPESKKEKKLEPNSESAAGEVINLPFTLTAYGVPTTVPTEIPTSKADLTSESEQTPLNQTQQKCAVSGICLASIPFPLLLIIFASMLKAVEAPS